MTISFISSGVTSSGLTISGNNAAVVQSGGTASNFTLMASQFATNGMSNQAGGTVVSAVLSSGGNLYEAGGVDRFTHILSGGFELVSSGGVASNTTMSGGTFRVAQGGTAVSATLLFNTIATTNGNGVFSATTISSGGEVIVSSGGLASASKVLGGGFEIVTSGGTSIAADIAGGGTQVVSSGGSASGTTLENGAMLALRGVAFNSGGSASFDSATSTLTVVEGATTYTETLAGNYTGLFFHASTGVSSSTLITVNTNAACFCSGTLLMTEHGLVAVEDLTTDDRLLTLIGGRHRRVRWVGRRRTRLSGHPRPWNVQPIRVAATSFGQGRPTHALRLSPDHAVHVDGVLIPIRHLLNGATITQEAIDRVTYYHVELAGPDGAAVHDVILAHGMPVESFLDTGNRSAFENGGAAIDVHPTFAREAWDAGGCAPLLESGALLSAVRARLLEFAAAEGFGTTDDPRLQLWADGVLIEPTRDTCSKDYLFDVPYGAEVLRLVSRSFLPCHINPDSSDARRLGVAVAWLEIDGVRIDLDDDTLSQGWHAREPGLRWTTGDATLPYAANCMVAARLCVAGRYWSDNARHDAITTGMTMSRA